MNKIDIIFPTYNNLAFTKTCLESFKRHTRANYSIINVDGGSTDGTLEWINNNKDKYNIVKVIENVKTCSKAYNAALTECTSDLVLLLTNDTFLVGDSLGKLIEAINIDKDIVIVGSKLLYPNDAIQHAGIVFTEQLEPVHVGRFRPKNEYSEYMLYPAVTLTFALMKRKEIPLFDEKYLYNYEDIDLCLKIILKNKKILYCPESILYHYESATTLRIPNFWNMRFQSYQIFHQLWNNYLQEMLISNREFFTRGVKL